MKNNRIENEYSNNIHVNDTNNNNKVDKNMNKGFVNVENSELRKHNESNIPNDKSKEIEPDIFS